jgi:hypothetical protein
MMARVVHAANESSREWGDWLLCRKPDRRFIDDCLVALDHRRVTCSHCKKILRHITLAAKRRKAVTRPAPEETRR